MAITYVNKNGSVGLSTSLTGVTAGNLIVVMLTWWDGSGTPTLSDGTNAPDGYSNVVDNAGAQLLRFGYWLSSPKSGNVTYTWTATGGGGETCVYEMSHGGAMTIENVNNGATGAGNTGTSGTATSTEASMVAFGGMGYYSQTGLTSATLDGVAADQTQVANDTTNSDWGGMSMRIMNNPGSYTSVIVVDTGTTNWATDVIAFKEAVAAALTVVGRSVLDDL